jgi:hypothetical protein
MVDFEKLSQESSGGGDGPSGESNPMDASWQTGDGLESSMGVGAATGPAKKKINEGMLLLAVVLAVAAGVLFLMRKTGAATIDQSLAAVELKIEQALAQAGVVNGASPAGDAKGLEAFLRNSDDVVALFLNDPSNKQVAPENLKKNPFYRLIALKPSDDKPQIVQTMTAEQREQQLRQQQLRAEVSMLQLQTVMQGRTPIAVISNRVVREQETLGSFTVVAIEPRSVVLAADGNSYRLTMKTPLIETRD